MTEGNEYKPQDSSENSTEPELSHTPGDRVRVPGKDGRVEYWKFRGVTSDGKVSVYDKDLNIKLIDPEVHYAYNGPLKEGSIVKVIRSNRLVDDGWKVVRLQEPEQDGQDTMVTVEKYLPVKDGTLQRHTKDVTLKSIEARN